MIDRRVIEAEELTDLQGAESDLRGKELYDCTFTRCDLRQSVFTEAVLEECSFVGCDLDMVTLVDASLRGVHFRDCKLMGVDWTAARRLTFQVTFNACKLSYGIFSGMRLAGLAFVDCLADEVDFSGADLRRARFERTRLTRADFSRADLTNADLSSSTGYVLDPTACRLSNTKISMQAGFELLELQGLVVEP